MSTVDRMDAKEPSGAHRRVLLLLVIAGVIGLVAAGLIVLPRGGHGPGSTTTTEAPATTVPPATTAPPTTAPPTTVPPVDTSTAVYPSAASSVRFDDPVAAARGFAVEFVGFVNPVVGAFQPGDSQSGEVEVRPSTPGPVTTVFVRRLGGTWWVLGSATANLQLHRPAALSKISSPVRLQGVSTAFEANVSVEVREDGARRPIGDGYVMGGSMGTLEPFDGTIVFADPRAAMGAIVLFTVSMEDGRVWEASVVRIGFGPAGGLVPASACPSYSMPRPAPGTAQTVTKVFYSCDVDAAPVPTYRVTSESAAVLRTALEQLLIGPTPAESSAGLQSWFTPATSGMLRSVSIGNGRAVVDFGDLRAVIPNASTSAGSRLLLSQLDATVFQFPTVTSVVYEINGDCEAFSAWLQYGGCEPRTRTSGY